MAPAAWDADILPKCMRKATMQRISRAWAQRPRETGLRNVLMWGRASWKIIAGSLRPRVGDSGRLDTSMIAEPAGRSEPSLQLKKSATSKLAPEDIARPDQESEHRARPWCLETALLPGQLGLVAPRLGRLEFVLRAPEVDREVLAVQLGQALVLDAP